MHGLGSPHRDYLTPLLWWLLLAGAGCIILAYGLHWIP